MKSASFHVSQCLSQRVLTLESLPRDKFNLSERTEPLSRLDKVFAAKANIGSEKDFSEWADPAHLFKLKKELSSFHQIPENQIHIAQAYSEMITQIFSCFTEKNQSFYHLGPSSHYLKKSCIQFEINHLEIPLNLLFQVQKSALHSNSFGEGKLLYLSHPNHISGIPLRLFDILEICETFEGIVIADERFLGYAQVDSCISLLDTCPNLIIIKSFAYEWGLGGIGYCYSISSAEITKYLPLFAEMDAFSKTVIDMACLALTFPEKRERSINETLELKKELIQFLSEKNFVQEIFHSEAGFVFIQVQDARKLFQYLLDHQILVSYHPTCEYYEQCLTIAIGNSLSQQKLLKTLDAYAKDNSGFHLMVKELSKKLQKASSFFGIFKKIFS